MADQLIRPEFSEPWVRTASVPIAPQNDDEIDPSDLEMAMPFLLERIVVTEDTINDNVIDPGPSYEGIGWLTGRWWTRGCQERSGPRMPLEIFNRSRTQSEQSDPWNPNGSPWGQIAWDFRDGEQPIIPVNGSIYGTWEDPGVAGAVPFGPYVATFGVIAIGVRTGKPTYLQLDITFGQSTGGAPPGSPGPTGPAGGGPESTNRLEEDLRVDSVNVTFNTRRNQGLAFVPDSRVWSHLIARLRIEPTGQALTPDGNLSPLIAYGQSRQILRRNVMICLRRSPVLLDTRDVIGFEFRNNAPAMGGSIIRPIVSMIGRTMPRRECGA